jgi:hypothetical protein
MKGGSLEMGKLKYLWVRYGTPRNLKVLYILMALTALVVAGGAPSTGGGNGAASQGWSTF